MALHRPTLFNLMNSIVGVSILSIPFCFHQCGVLLGPVAMIIMAFFTKKTCLFLLISGQLGRRRSYESLAQYTYGQVGKFAVEACIIGLMAGTLCAFNVIIGDLAPTLIGNFFGLEQTPTLRAVVMIVMAFSVGLPLSLMRDISSLSSFSAVSLSFYGAFVIHVIFSSLPHLLEGAWIKELNVWRPAGLLQCLPIFSLAFSCQTQLFGLYDSLPEPSLKTMENVVNVGIKIVACVNLCVGFFGYLAFYDVGVKGDVLTNYGSSTIGEILKMGFVMSVIVSFPLMVFPMRASINSLLFPSQTAGTENMPGGPGYMPQNRFVIITVAVVSGTLTVGVFIPQIEFVLGLTGATIGTLIILVLPASMYLHAIQDAKGEQKNIARITMVFGIICLIASTYSVLTIEESGHHDKVKPVVPVKPISNLSNVVGPIQPAKDGNIRATVGVPTELVGTPTHEPAVSKTEKPVEVKKTVQEAREKAAQRKEPAMPKAPDEKAAEETAIKKNEKGADPVNEKRQLMSTDDAKHNDDTQDDKNLSSKLDQPVKSAFKVASKVDLTKKENQQKIERQREKKSHVDSGIKDLKVVKKADSRGKRHIEEDPVKEKKDDGIRVGVTVTPTEKTVISTPALSLNSSAVPSINPTTVGKTLKEPSDARHIGNITGDKVKSRELKSSDIVGRKLKSNMSESKDESKTGKYSNLWAKRLAKTRSVRAKRLNKIGTS